MALKQMAGSAIASLNPQCGFDKAVFIIGHMRCGSTALSNILCTRPDISGYGEAHIAYTGAGSLGVLTLNQLRRNAWKPGARHLFDKILHNRYDGDAPPEFFAARAIFVARNPDATVPSIRNLFETLGSTEYRTNAQARTYYRERLTGMINLWNRFDPARRCAITYENLTAEPEAALARLTAFLGCAPPLTNHYVSHKASVARGAGDPLTSARHSAIVAGKPPVDAPPVEENGLHGLYNYFSNMDLY